MGKLTDNHFAAQPIGNDGLLLFIDEMNDLRARSGNRYRFEPHMDRDREVLTMREVLGIPRPANAGTPSPLYSGNLRIAAE